ncbi:hypothetical protein Dimus_032759 [Dionaea muscipula]
MTNDDNRYEHSSYDRTKPSSYDGFGGRESRRNHTDDQDFDISRMNDRDRHRSVRGGRRRDRDGKPFGSHDYNRHRDSERGYKGRRRSLSRERFRNQSRSPSRSPPRLKSKRSTGFDMGPPTPTTMSGISISVQLYTHEHEPCRYCVEQRQEESTVAWCSTSNANICPKHVSNGVTPLGALALMPAHAMTQQATRHARRVYVGGLPPMANEQIIAIFFSQVMAAIGGNSAGSGDAVVNVYINHEKKFAFVEMRTVEEASNAMALDGIVFEGVAVRVRRPTDYNPTLAATLGPSQPSPHLNLAAIGLVPSAISAAEGKDRIFVGGIPYYIAEAQIRELLESFGPLKGFDLVKDRETGNSRGYGFCVYQDPAVTDIACEALNGLKMGDKTLTVRRAIVSNMQADSEQGNMALQMRQQIGLQNMASLVGEHNLFGVQIPASTDTPTKILCLTQVVTSEALRDDNEYEEIMEDMRDECGKFGALVKVVIPRPGMNGEQVPGVGKVFLEYSDIGSCAKAKSMLGGRKFGGNTVTAAYYSEDKFYGADYSG